MYTVYFIHVYLSPSSFYLASPSFYLSSPSFYLSSPSFYLSSPSFYLSSPSFYLSFLTICLASFLILSFLSPRSIFTPQYSIYPSPRSILPPSHSLPLVLLSSSFNLSKPSHSSFPPYLSFSLPVFQSFLPHILFFHHLLPYFLPLLLNSLLPLHLSSLSFYLSLPLSLPSLPCSIFPISRPTPTCPPMEG